MADAFDFNKALAEIKEINRSLQNETHSPGEALAQYEKGMKLLKLCEEHLNDAENKYVEIKKKYGLKEETDQETAADADDSETESGSDIPF